MPQDAAQADLFKRTTGPEGFRYQPEIMSPEEECVLVERIAALPLAEFLFQGFAAKRRVLSFGWRYDFERGRFEKTEPVPGFLLDIRTRAAAFAGLKADDLPLALVTEYSRAHQSAGTKTGRSSKTCSEFRCSALAHSPALQARFEMAALFLHGRAALDLPNAGPKPLGVGAQYSARRDSALLGHVQKLARARVAACDLTNRCASLG
jgi:hypothetical protein